MYFVKVSVEKYVIFSARYNTRPFLCIYIYIYIYIYMWYSTFYIGSVTIYLDNNYLLLNHLIFIWTSVMKTKFYTDEWTECYAF